ncbi:insecticidal delta-endotoxin Cry8Ea1 family protein [Kitasatospora sp. NPDC002965]|uniref:insecticidal delta-endotoxin Cry8Ea1 family protein n=1 Tax=Kitasatospora sp. NPDC002965 TaxID=3154775 RepID=UPI0033B5C9FF
MSAPGFTAHLPHEDRVEKLVEEEIEKAYFADLQNRLSGIQQVASLYVDLAKEGADLGHIRTNWTVAHDDILAADPSFRDSRYSVALIPVSAQLTNMRMLLLADVVKHGEKWGFASSTVQRYKDELLKEIDPDSKDSCAWWILDR